MFFMVFPSKKPSNVETPAGNRFIGPQTSAHGHTGSALTIGAVAVDAPGNGAAPVEI